ncbi:keratinocyte-associated protein 3 isoform X2 [Carettochelys insculpta]|uniref:keratinocyte-associated protein 3 isoform X2 n=1 Tax=Carettochelys insculpta TaxID=44489 RepID=UPI003EC09862
MGCGGGCGFDLGRGPQRLMRTGITLIVLGHVNFILGAIVHGTVLRHVANPERTVTSEYTTANVISVGSGLLSITAGIVAILVSRNLLKSALHWALLCTSLLNCLLSAACSLGLALAISLTIASRGHRLILGCNSSAIPADARAAIVTNDCPFDTTRIYDTALALWFPSMVMAAVEALLSGRCCVVALTLRGIGPCAHAYSRQQEKEMAMKEVAPEDRPMQELRQLLPVERGVCT